MKVLVTGANGFLGAWLTRRLLAEGHEVSALVRKNSDLSELAGVTPKYVYGDVTDKSSLLESFRGQEVIFHLAGVVAYKKSDIEKLERVNVGGTQNVVDVCAELQIRQLLHVSSVVAIGASFTPTPLTENFEYNIAHLHLGYFDTKRKAEQIVRQAVRENRIRAVCVNPSTIYGFGDAKKGSRKNQLKVARGKMPFYTSGGVNVVAVEDVIEGILLALAKGQNGERYILANENMTIKSLFQKISGFAGVPAPQLYLPNWALHTIGFIGDQLQPMGVDIGFSQVNAHTATLFHWFDSAKAQRELGFKPTSSDAAIEKSVKWMHDNGYLDEKAL
ncbi:MAG: NAD-dependent epimerase/dehydratase family protein [Pseudobdellovibrio sp.]